MSHDAPPPPPPGPPPPGQPGYYGGGYAQPTTSQKAVWALVTGVLGLCCGLLSLVALPLGLSARSDIKNARGGLTGDGLALAGVVLGAIGVAWFLISIILGATGVLDFDYTFGTG